jgi:hypothetical protein
MGSLAPYSRKLRGRQREKGSSPLPLHPPPPLPVGRSALLIVLGLDARMLVINLGLDSAPHGYERVYKYVRVGMCDKKFSTNKFALGVAWQQGRAGL